MPVLCAICSQPATRFQPMYRFGNLLKELDIVGDKAHVECLSQKREERRNERKAAGVPESKTLKWWQQDLSDRGERL